MEREIKFRGKRISNGKWLYGDLMHDTVGGCYVFPIDCAALYKENAILPETIGQYTGLKDKNGKEIYEGDVVRVGIVPFNYIGKNPEPYYVDAVCVYSQGSFLYKRISPFDKKKLSRNWTYRPVYRHDIYTVEIIGNITDNEDLLKDGRD